MVKVIGGEFKIASIVEPRNIDCKSILFSSGRSAISAILGSLPIHKWGGG